MTGGRDTAGDEVRRVLPGWRPLFAAFLALTLLSTLVLYVLPTRTDRYFAWTVSPALTAAFLGGGYAAGFVLVVLSIRRRVWADARIAWVTVCVFVWLTLVATLLHLDRFHFTAPDLLARSAAWLWIVVYVVVPPWMTVMLVAQRRAPGVDPDVIRPIPRWLAAGLAAQGAVLLAVGTGLMVAPMRMRTAWPWALTPLTGRAMGAWCLALGVAAFLALRKGDLTRLRAAAVTYVCLAVLQAGALTRFPDAVRWDSAAAWIYVVVLLLMAVTGGYGWLADRRRTELGAVHEPTSRPA
jgi:hypothetical protein